MPCIDGSGEMTEMARKIMATVAKSLPLSEVAQQTELPMYRVRSAVRELVDAGLVEGKDEIYVLTDAGRTALAKAH